MRAVVGFLLTFIIVLAIIWGGVWWYAEGRMADGFGKWLALVSSQGWKVSYDSAKRGVSPLAAAFNITDLSLTSPPDSQGRTAVVNVPSFGVHVDALNPLVLHNDLPNRININVANTFDAVVTFGTITDSIVLSPQLVFTHQAFPFTSGNGGASNISILASQGSLLVLHIHQGSFHWNENRAAGAGATAVNEQGSIDGIALSPLMVKLASIPFGGAISHVALDAAVSGPLPASLWNANARIQQHLDNPKAQEQILIGVLHDWAASSGSGMFKLNLGIGPTTLASAATLKFDSSAQPSGTADVTADHLDQFTAAVQNAYPQVQDRIAQVEAQLSPYLTTTSAGQTLTIHAVYGNGAVTVNGQKLAPMPPIDWNALQNAPP